MTKRYLALTITLLAATTASAAFAATRGGGQVVSTVGKEYFEPGAFVAATLRFSPDTIRVASGESVTFVHADRDTEPHTVTLALNKGQLPKSFEGPCKPCEVASHHLKNPRNEGSGVRTYVLNKGLPGFDTFGDSLALAPKGPHKSATVVISAPAGTTLYFMCAIHPWMQGKIVVT